MTFIESNILDPIQPTLPVDIWDKVGQPFPILKPKVAHFIQKCIYDALHDHGYKGAKDWLRLYLTGSLTSFQYSDQSDCDVSLFIDAAKFPEWSRQEMIGIMVTRVDGRKIPDTPYPLQDYVVPHGISPQDLYKPGLRSAYDIDNNQWVVPPDKSIAHNPKAEEANWYIFGLEQADKLESLLSSDPHKAIQQWHYIHQRRKEDQAAGKGDYSIWNLAYKFLDKRGLFKRISEITGEHIA